jgi:hypothetical protein
VGGATKVTLNAVKGVASFSKLELPLATLNGTSYILTASYPLSSLVTLTVPTAPISVVTGTANHLMFAIPLPTPTAGSSFQLTVYAKDKYGNQANYNGTATLSLVAGNGSLNATATITNGVATFTNLVLATDGTYELEVKSGTLVPGTTSFSVDG